MNNRQTQFTTPIPIVCLDPIVHTDDHPYCGDPDCHCAEDLYAEVERQEQEYLHSFTQGPQDELEQTGTHAPNCRCPWCSAEEV